MKILAIRGRNLASLAGDFGVELENDPLAGAGLFAITGKTGAGKSTLLDALCLALYDKTPRLSRRGGVPIGHPGEDAEHRLSAYDVRSLLRRGTGEGHAEVEFVGRDGRHYRARWSVRRARRRPDGRFQKQEMELQDLATGRMLGGTKSETLEAIERRLGLSFEQFCRSALLAQGEFAAFLTADAAQRAELLERMTGTEIYGELSRAAYRRWADERRELEALERAAAEQEILDDDARARLLERRPLVAAEVERAQERLRAAEDAERCQREHAEALRAVAELERVEDRSRRAAAEHAATEAAAERALGTARAELRDAEPALAAAAHLDADIRAAAERVDEADRARAAAEQSNAAAGDDVRRLERELETTTGRIAAGYAVVRAARAELADELEAANRQARAAEAAQRDARDALQRAQAVAEAAAERAGQAPLAGARAALDELRARRDRLRALEAAAAAAGRAAGERERAERLEARADATAAAAAERAGRLETEHRRTEAALAEARRSFDRMRLAVDLSQHRAELEAGEPCPLCGATEHPFAHRAPIDALLDEQRGRLGELRGDTQRLERELAQARADGRAAERESAEQRRRARDAAAELESARVDWRTAIEELGELALLPEPGTAEAAEWVRGRATALDEHLEAARSAEREAVRLDDERTRAQGNVAARRNDLDQARDAAAEAARSADAAGRELADCESAEVRARRLARGAGQRARPDRPAAGWRERLDALDADAAALADLRARLEAARERRDERAAALAERTGAAERLRAELERLRERRAGHFGGRAVDDVRADLQARVDRAEQTRRDAAAGRSRAAEAVASAQARLEAAREAVVGRAEARERAAERLRATFNEVGEGERGGLPDRAALELARQALNEATEAASRVAVRIEVDDRNRARKRELEAEIAEQRRRAGVYESLSGLIGSADGNRFRTFAQSLTLEALLGHANAHLGELAPRYRLQRVPGHDLDLQVLDRDMGDEVRSVNSLSGGESFLVSLALALGLSSLSARDVRVESLLIDEGFGTLDPDTLEVALSVLDALQASGRQVGLISHVPGLAERIGVRVVVEKRGGGRSAVRVAGAG